MTGKLIRQLRREARANPKKAGFLALIFVVAIYFWVPILWSWAAPEPIRARPPAATATPPPSQQAASAPAAEPRAARPGWQQLAEWIDGDPLMRPGWRQELLAHGRNPFAPSRAKQAAEADAYEKAVAHAGPSELGLVLTSTVIGPLRRTAMINGKVYSQGSEVQAADGTRFILSRVEPRRVVLTQGGQQFELAIVREAAGRIAIGAAQ